LLHSGYNLAPQYRLRVDDITVVYDVTETQVEVVAIVTKAVIVVRRASSR
jgi:hypothetical protein